MKRKNKSVQHARALPEHIVGGGHSLLQSKAIAEGLYKPGEGSVLDGGSILGTDRADRSLQLHTHNKSISPRAPAPAGVKFLHKKPAVDAENYSPVKTDVSLDLMRQATTEKTEKAPKSSAKQQVRKAPTHFNR